MERQQKVHMLDNPPTSTFCGRRGKNIDASSFPSEVTCKECLKYIRGWGIMRSRTGKIYTKLFTVPDGQTFEYGKKLYSKGTPAFFCSKAVLCFDQEAEKYEAFRLRTIVQVISSIN